MTGGGETSQTRTYSLFPNKLDSGKSTTLTTLSIDSGSEFTQAPREGERVAVNPRRSGKGIYCYSVSSKLLWRWNGRSGTFKRLSVNQRSPNVTVIHVRPSLPVYGSAPHTGNTARIHAETLLSCGVWSREFMTHDVAKSCDVRLTSSEFDLKFRSIKTSQKIFREHAMEFLVPTGQKAFNHLQFGRLPANGVAIQMWLGIAFSVTCPRVRVRRKRTPEC